MENNFSHSIQELVINRKSLKSISDEDLRSAFQAHMRKARHTEGDWIEFKFAAMTLQVMQERENSRSLRWSWFWGFISAIAGALLIEIIK